MNPALKNISSISDEDALKRRDKVKS